eukprot:gene8802-18211_t
MSSAVADSAQSPRLQVAVGMVSTDTWAQKSRGGFRKKFALIRESSEKANPLNMRLSADSIGFRPTEKNYYEGSRPHSASTAKRNSSESMARVLALRPTSAKQPAKGSPEYYVHPDMTPTNITFRPALPKFVENDKLVLRYYGHFFEDRVWDPEAPLGLSVVENKICRYLTLYYYITDDSFEMIEPKQANSGIDGGRFYKKDTLLKDDGTLLIPQDIEVGRSIHCLSREIFITDADEFTRHYHRKEFGKTFAPALLRPDQAREDLGAEFATGLMSTAPPKSEHHGTRSHDFNEKRISNNRARQFLNFDGRVLRFICVETKTPKGDMTQQKVNFTPKQYLLLFYLVDNTIETRLVKSARVNVNDQTVVMKKCQLPKNWRDVRNKFAEPIYYTYEDLKCGHVIDCYGRYLLLVTCDEGTKKLSEELGLIQRELTIQAPEKVTIQHPIPQLGDKFLAIGGEEDTLRNVYWAPKMIIKKKIMDGRVKFIRARIKMITEHFVDRTRTFLLSFFLEDGTMQIFEEAKYNSGVTSGPFLKKGKYINTLPPEDTLGEGGGDAPRPFKATDIFLGNVFSTNGAKFQVIEMDSLSMRICEENPDDFPMFDAYRIAYSILHKVLKLPDNIRSILSSRRVDREGKKWLDKESFLRILEALHLTEHLNDQQLLSLMRRVKDSKDDKYYYHELCDLFSHLSYLESNGGSSRPNLLRSALAGGRDDAIQKEAFLKSLRCRRVQWRRTIRKDPRSRNGLVTLATLLAIFKRQGVRFSRSNVDYVKDFYQSDDAEAARLLPNLDNEPPLFEIKASDKDLHARFSAQDESRPDIRSSSRLNRTTVVGVSMSPWIGTRAPHTPTPPPVVVVKKHNEKQKDIRTQRMEVMTSVLRASINMDEESPYEIPSPETENDTGNLEEEGPDERFVIIDYNALCDDIYG